MHRSSQSEYACGFKQSVPYMFYLKPSQGPLIDTTSNFLLLNSKRHLYPAAKVEKNYEFHTKIVKSSRGEPVGLKKCTSEYSLESFLGAKLRINSFNQQRNYMSIRRLGDKNYVSPEQSPEFFKKSTVFRAKYGLEQKFDRRSIKQQLGPVDGIFSKIMKIQSERSLKIKDKYYRASNL